MLGNRLVSSTKKFKLLEIHKVFKAVLKRIA